MSRPPKPGPAVGFQLGAVDAAAARTAFLDALESQLVADGIACERGGDGEAVAVAVFETGRGVVHLRLGDGRGAAWLHPEVRLGVEAGRRAVQALWRAASRIPTADDVRAYPDLASVP